MRFAHRLLQAALVLVISLGAHAAELPLKVFAVGTQTPTEFRAQLRKPLPKTNPPATDHVVVLRKNVLKDRVEIDLKPKLPLPQALLDQVGTVYVVIRDRNPKKHEYDVNTKSAQGDLKGSISLSPYKKGSVTEVVVTESTVPPWLVDLVIYAAIQAKAITLGPPQ